MALPSSFTPSLLRQLELQQLLARRAFLGFRQGMHYSPKRGHGIEFSDYRQYERGDDLRHLDWNLLARSERHYIKRFREEQDLLVHMVLDNSASMFCPDQTKWLRCKEIALAIAYVSSMQQDRIQLAVPGVFTAKKYRGQNLVNFLAQDLDQVQPLTKANFNLALKTSTKATNFPGVVFYISDFLEEIPTIQENLQNLISRNLDLRLIQVLHPSEVDPEKNLKVMAIDSEDQQSLAIEINEIQRQEYQKYWQKHQQAWQSFATNRSIPWTSCLTTDSLSEVCKIIFDIGLR